MKARIAAVVALLAGCSFEPPADVPDDDDTGDDDSGQTPDAEVPDSELGCTPSTTTCTDGRYVECSAEGVVTRAMDCPLGCDAQSSRCIDVDPSNGVAQYIDQARTDAAVRDLTLSEGSSINTDSGLVFNGGTSVTVPSVDIGAYRVFMVKSLTVTGTTTVQGVDALIIVSDGNVAISGLIDASANLRVSGPGGGTGSCAGMTTDSASSTFIGGGGGGGNAEAGAEGGSGNSGASLSGAGGAALSDVDLDPLRGGCVGGDSRNGTSTCMSHGGGGGGGVQIVSRTEILFMGNGGLDASGGGGEGAHPGVEGCTSTSGRAGGGGGAGGSILLEAPQVRLEGGSVVLSTKGGGGSAQGISGIVSNGEDGGIDADRAAGGQNAVNQSFFGGMGGDEAVSPGQGSSGGANQPGGGGGGAVGRVRFNTTSGTVNPVGGALIRSEFTSSQIRTRLVP